MMKKKIVLEECTSDCWQYNDGCLLSTSDAIPLNCPLPDDREDELRAEIKRLKNLLFELTQDSKDIWTKEEIDEAKAEGARLAKLFMQDDPGVEP